MIALALMNLENLKQNETIRIVGTYWLLWYCFDTINRYAIGVEDDKYSNTKPIISMIAYARRHTEISGMRLDMRDDDKAANENWDNLYKQLRQLNGYN